jgi:carboxyl-terminal processing protease
MSKKIKIVLSLSLAAVIALAFTVGCFVGVDDAPPTDLEDFEVVEQAWEILVNYYVENDQIDTEALAQGAINGMVEALGDPYTSYLDADTYRLSLQSLAGSFEGIGAYVTSEEGQIIIVSPIADSPADRAGIEAGDIIVAVDGQSTEGMSLTEVVLLVQGPEGTTVDLLILHEGETEPVLISVVRAVIEVSSVDFEMMGEIAYINITGFTDRTAEEMLLALEEADQQGVEGVIIDMRGNLGGPLDAAIDVTSFFLEEGVVVEVVDNEGHRDVYPVKNVGMTTDLPLVVLVNEYSASASEVVAGALQDYGRAVIAGARTLGKGSANILLQLGDGSALYVTSARWFTPDGRLIEGEGIEPEYEIDLENEDAIQWALDYLRNS